MTMLRRAIRDTAILTASVLVARLLALAFRYVLALRMSVTEYGQLAIVFSAATYLSQLGTLNLGNASARYIPTCPPDELPGLFRALYRLCARSAGVASIVCLVLVLATNNRWPVAALAAVCVVAYAFQSLGEGVLRTFYRTGVQATAQIVTAITRLTAIFILALVLGPPLRLNAAMFALASGSLLSWLFVARYARSLWPTQAGSMRLTHVSSYDLLRFGGLLTISSTVTLGLGFVNRLLLKHLVGIEDVAHYDNALLAYSTLQAFLSSFVLVSLPVYARASQSAAVPVISTRRMLAVYLVFYSTLLALQVSGLAEWAFNAGGVERYAPMYPVFLVVVLGFPFEFLFVSISSPLQARSRVLSVGIASSISAAAGLITACVTIPRVGIVGAAVSSLVGTVFLGASAVYLRRFHSLALNPR